MLKILLISTVLAILVCAFCSLCQAILQALNNVQMETFKKSNGLSEQMQRLQFPFEDSSAALITLNTAAKIIGAAVAGATAARVLGESKLLPFASVLALTILLFAEFIPGAIGLFFAHQLAPYVAYPLRLMVILLRPFVWLYRGTFRLCPKRGEEIVCPLDLSTTVSKTPGDIEETEERVINNIVELKNKIVREVMTPRTVTFSMNERVTLGNALAMLTELGSHSRIPVYSREPNNVTGIILRKDVLQAMAEGKNKLTLGRFKQPAHFVPETAPLTRILIDFFNRRQHLFIVVDEYGTMTGVISLEDILEEIVGMEIIDESDKAKDMRELARTRNIESRKKMKTNLSK